VWTKFNVFSIQAGGIVGLFPQSLQLLARVMLASLDCCHK